MRKSAWCKGVELYAEELKDFLAENGLEPTKKNMLNGAASWKDYSWGGSSLIYNADIAARLCTPSELKRKKGGDLPPNRDEEWLDTQARALAQAAWLVIKGMV